MSPFFRNSVYRQFPIFWLISWLTFRVNQSLNRWIFHKFTQKEKASVTYSVLMLLFGRDDKTRTCDLAPPRRVRYQLRYIPIPYCQ